MITPIDGRQADRFLQLLGKNPAGARLRGFPHRLNPNRFHAKTNPNGIRARKGAYDLAAASRWQREGCGVYIVINDGGDKAHEITSCRAFFAEWDDRPLDWQLNAWRTFGLGHPTCVISTGGKSAHLYWVLKEPIPPAQWAPIQAALLEFAEADRSCKDASRVMRLPGAHYLGPDGQPTGQASIVDESGILYTPEEVDSWIFIDEFAEEAPPFTAPPPQATPRADRAPRPLEQIHEALAAIPRRTSGTYIDYRNILWGLIKACEEAGADIDTAISLMEQHSPSASCGWDISQVARSGGEQITAATFWFHARQHGWKPPRTSSVADEQFYDWPDPNEEPTPNHNGHQPPPPPPAVLTLAQVRKRLQESVANGASRQELEALRLELADAGDFNPASLRDLLASIQREYDAAFSIAAESASLRAAVDRQEVGACITSELFLPPSLVNALRIRTQSLPVDDAAAVTMLLVAASGVAKLGSQVVVSESADYRVPLNLYAALVARSGAKKSPVSRLLVKELTRELRLELARDHTRALAAWHEENRGIKPADRSEQPRPVYLSVSDFTAEALSEQLQIQEAKGMGLLIHRDEIAGMFGSLNAYRKGRGGDEELLLEAYDGSGVTSLRVAVNGGGRFYDRCHLSIWGTIQPAVLKALVAGGDASGLWARFLFIPLPDRVVPLPESESYAEQQAAQAAAEALADICSHIYRQPRLQLPLSAAARRAFVAYEARCQRDVQKTVIAAQGALFGKSAGKALRIAGLLHMVHQAAPDGERSSEISEEMLTRAITLTDHINTWTLSLHASVAEGAETNDLMRLVHRIAEAAGGPVRWSEVARRLSKQQRRDIDSAAATAAMNALVELGVGEVEIGSRGGVSYRAIGALP
jgi:hypothetical protein